MRLDDLIQGFGIALLDHARGDLRICDISEDSRTVVPSSLFVARLGGEHDGRRFIQQAIDAGAEAVLTGDDVQDRPCDPSIAWLTAQNVSLALAQMAERFFGHPSRSLALAGVTGTNGKSTVASLLQQLVDEPKRRCGLLGTVRNIDGRGSAPAEMTTPPALEISYALATMVDAGFGAASLEVSSHGLAQDRTSGLDFDVGIFTNLSGDHLDYHKTMEAYASAKSRLFTQLAADRVAIVNADDPSVEQIVKDCRSRILRCTIDGASGADVCASIGAWSLEGTPVRLEGPWGVIEGYSPLLGQFNVMNLLLAVAGAHAMGVPVDRLRARLASLRAPEGRLDQIQAPGLGRDAPMVFVDYAHTDDALAHALAALRPVAERRGGALRVVMGCGGDRDRSKRSRMGRIASEGADAVVVTSDNPRTERPSAIIDDILTGIDRSRGEVVVEVDRERAIHRAIMSADGLDVVLIAGKGHEDYQLLPDPEGEGVRRVAFDDRRVARSALESRAALASQTQSNQPEAALS